MRMPLQVCLSWPAGPDVVGRLRKRTSRLMFWAAAANTVGGTGFSKRLFRAYKRQRENRVSTCQCFDSVRTGGGYVRCLILLIWRLNLFYRSFHSCDVHDFKFPAAQKSDAYRSRFGSAKRTPNSWADGHYRNVAERFPLSPLRRNLCHIRQNKSGREILCASE